MTPETRTRVWREHKPFVAPAILVIIYMIVRLIYGAASASQGVLTPSGGVDSKLAVLALATLGMRMLVLVVVPCAVVYRLVMRLLRTWTVDDRDAS